MNRIFVPALALAATTAFAGTAFADEDAFSNKEGTFAVGVDSTIANSTGLGLRYYITEALGLQLTFGGNLNSESTEPDGGDKTGLQASRFDISLLGEYRIATSRQATLAGYGGLNLGLIGAKATGENADDANEDIITSAMDLAFEVGIRGEVFLSKHFSVYIRGGLTIDPVSDRENDLGTPSDAQDDVA
ncbi:MAG: hypothetical protein KGO50_01085, partial [Myxococcales bacterium]|nr:hypothetical protein [Myxococcales bacterium]